MLKSSRPILYLKHIQASFCGYCRTPLRYISMTIKPILRYIKVHALIKFCTCMEKQTDRRNQHYYVDRTSIYWKFKWQGKTNKHLMRELRNITWACTTASVASLFMGLDSCSIHQNVPMNILSNIIINFNMQLKCKYTNKAETTQNMWKIIMSGVTFSLYLANMSWFLSKIATIRPMA